MRPLQPSLTLWQKWLGYQSLFARCLSASFSYRATTVTNVITAVFIYAIPMLVWRQVYSQNPNLSVSQAQMFPYLLLACCVNYATAIGVEFRIGTRIRMGLIATDLLKPVDFQIAQGVQCFSDGLFNGFLGIVVFICGYLVLGREVFPASLESLVLFMISFTLAFIVLYNISFIFVQGVFYTNSGYGVVTARMALQQAFSGMAAPLTLYPPLLNKIGLFLPFRHTIYTPVSIYMGWVKGEDALFLILQQALWAIGLFLAGKLLMNLSLKQLEVQGG